MKPRLLLFALALLSVFLIAAPAAASDPLLGWVFAREESVVLQYGYAPTGSQVPAGAPVWLDFQDAKICSTTTGVMDSTNYGGATTCQVGWTAATSKCRTLVRMDPGIYLPPGSFITRGYMTVYSATVALADSLMGSLLANSFVEGTGTGAGTDRTGVSWKYRDASPGTAWYRRGADSALVVADSCSKAPVYGGVYDRTGTWASLGAFKVTAGVYKRFDITTLLRLTFPPDNRPPNYGWAFRIEHETTTTSRMQWAAKEMADVTTEKFIIYYVSLVPSAPIGRGTRGVN